MSISGDITLEKLKTELYTFYEKPLNQLIVRIRRFRAEQIRQLLSRPENVDLDTFNKEIWSIGYGMINNKRVNIFEMSEKDTSSIEALKQAIEKGEFQYYGNSIWGSGSRQFGPQLTHETDLDKQELIHHAIKILNDEKKSPIEKAREIYQIRGFGYNTATGQVMVFHPDQFALYNKESKSALKGLGYTFESIDEFQQQMTELYTELGVKDYLELDFFLFQLNQNQLSKSIHVEPTEIPQDPIENTELNQTYSISDLSNDIGESTEAINRWIRAIERKGQGILYGPPGTGKTYIAEWLAKYFIGGGEGFSDLVQFHPSYAYEDFIQGLRPVTNENQVLQYDVVPGRFLEFCEKARTKTGDCVLIIDEINRANLSRVFGELMYLLEYRDRSIPLAGGGNFSIPTNVKVIGTMNTADRSIALMDNALRRRFAFISLYPNYDILRQYHQQTETNVEPLIEVLHDLNEQIGDPHYEIGISFFLIENLHQHLGDIWCMEIEPYLEEYFFDQPNKIQQFRWQSVNERLRV
ncbi:McrB family protein [Texcoconibacillus texcoconensis]|uniref:MoxR-like ATPase n=1 Tax=Texcoconibacillus texcoconensis TaxID=1095777 RepID=A0A840QM48_9BACI|nr:AAA family ATPase [Texcoconibacillus texcoconensis]MBB5172447.1 MoxR-like ATPase [Texcoconibacillus texcoconensis]